MTANDGYERYYTEKLWQLVPEVYKNEDAAGEFRAIVALIAEQAATSRRSIDRLWEDQHVETSDDWAVPYIGQLVGARLVSAQDGRARRVDVGNTIRFRRRRGTPDLLDTLVRAMSGWDVILEEGFRRLARVRHRLDPRASQDGIFTKTFRGGFADLRKPAGAELADSPFNEYFHTLDTRLLHGQNGRFGIRKLNFHLYRPRTFKMLGVDPVELTNPDGEGVLRIYTVDPSGRDVPLFINGEGDGVDDKAAITREAPLCVNPREWQVKQPMRCRLLGHERYEVSLSGIAELASLSNPPLAVDSLALAQVQGVVFQSESALRRRLIDFGATISGTLPEWYLTLLSLSLLQETGKRNLYPDQVAISMGGDIVGIEHISAGNLSDLLCHPEPITGITEMFISPEQGRFSTISAAESADLEPLVARYHYGFSSQLGAGPYPRPPVDLTPTRIAVDGVVPSGGTLQGDGLKIADNRSYELSIVDSQSIEDNAALIAGAQSRPFILLRGADALLTQAVLVPEESDQHLIIDGGWYAGQDPNSDLLPGDTFDLVIGGALTTADDEFDFERIEIRFATLDPGGQRADGLTIPPLRLVVRSRIKTLVLRRCISGPILVEKDEADDPSTVENLVICESVIDAANTTGQTAVSNLFGEVTLEGSTVFGDIKAAVLHASNSLVEGHIRVVNNQKGCFRFSATVDGADVRLPPRYRDYLGPIPPATFNSRRFGDPQFAQLSVVAFKALAQGAENGSQMGAFSHTLTPIRLRSIRAKVDEFGPAGQLAQYLFAEQPLAEFFRDADPAGPLPQVRTPAEDPDPGALIPPPPEPEPAPLPTRCEDDPIGDPDPDPVPEQIVNIALLNAEPGGAPSSWRDTDWLAAINRSIDPGAPTLPGVPFDKVDFQVEYDARFNTRPEAQGWIPINARTPSLFKLDQETLMFSVSGQTQAAYLQSQFINGSFPEQIHAHTTVMMNLAPGRSREDSGESFELQFQVVDSDGAARGMRAGWTRAANGSLFHLLRLDGAEQASPSFFNPQDRLLNNWMRVSLQADLKEDRTLSSLSDIIDSRELNWFGKGDFESGSPALRAMFGFTRKDGRAAGRMINYQIAGPGRPMRLWLQSVVPVKRSILALSFAVDADEVGTARILVRYEDSISRLATRIPTTVAAATLSVNGSGRIHTLYIPLNQADAHQHLLMCVERDWSHEDDQLRTSIRLLSARLTGNGDTPS